MPTALTCHMSNSLSQFVGGSVMILLGDISELLNGLSGVIYLFFALIFISLLILRVTRSREPRPFKVSMHTPLRGVYFELLNPILNTSLEFGPQK